MNDMRTFDHIFLGMRDGYPINVVDNLCLKRLTLFSIDQTY